MWAWIASLAAPLLDGRLKVFKIKSHLTEDEARHLGVPALAWKANQLADKQADAGAARARFGDAEAQTAQQIDEAAGIVLRRIVAVGRYVIKNWTAPARVPRALRQPLLTRMWELGTRNGHIMRQGKGLGCRSCWQHSRMRQASQWASQPCPGPGVVQGHLIRHVHGMRFCERCGGWIAKDGTAMTTSVLRRPCTGHPNLHGKRLLRRFLSQPPLPPYGRLVWPDGTVVEKPAKQPKAAGTGMGSKGPSKWGSGGALGLGHPEGPPPEQPCNSPSAASGTCTYNSPSGVSGTGKVFKKPREPGGLSEGGSFGKSTFPDLSSAAGPPPPSLSPAQAKLLALRQRVRSREAVQRSDV